MRRAQLAAAAILAIPAILAEPWPAIPANYTEVIPAMGPALLPGPDAQGRPSILRAQIVDRPGRIDFVFKEYGQNWLCLGDDGDPDNAQNYPAVGIFDAGAQAGGFLGNQVMDNAVEVARISIPMAQDRADCAEIPASGAGDSCSRLHARLEPATLPLSVDRGDVLVWAVLRKGSNCPGQWWLTYEGNPPYPAAPGGEITLGIHVREEH